MSFPEIWKSIEGYEGLYEVSNLGNVRSLDRILKPNWNSPSDFRKYPGKMLCFGIVSGYAHIVLCKNGTKKTVKVHRLVAHAFVEGYFEGACVNHKDGNKLNNRYENLEWCTQSHNSQHAYTFNLRRGRPLGEHHFAKRVIDITTGRIFNTIKEAAQAENISPSTLSAFFNDFPSCSLSEKMSNRLSKFVLQAL